MTNEQIKEKYKIEPIMKEMWVWDKFEKAELRLVLYKILEKNDGYPYKCLFGYYKNASDTNPNEPKEPKLGDMGYFWNDDKVFYAYGKLEGIDNLDPFPYLCVGFSWHLHFSHKKQHWMK
jgi:hypothetical protein